MKTVKQIIKTISNDYNELLSHIINEKNFHRYSDIAKNNTNVCYDLFQLIIQKNNHNFREVRKINDNLNYENTYGRFELEVYDCIDSKAVIKFKIYPYMVDAKDEGKITFIFSNWLKLAKFLVYEKNKYLKMISEFTHLKKSEWFILEKSKCNLKNFEIIFKDRYDCELVFQPTKNSKYYGID